MAETPPEEEAANLMQAPDEVRCKRSDGKTWRCHGWRIHEKPYCEKHYLQILQKSLKRKSRAGKNRSGNSKNAGGGGGFVVNKSRRLGISSGGGGRGKRSRGRDGEAASSEEVFLRKRPRSKRVSVEGAKDEEEDSEETEDDERRNVVNVAGKRSGEKGRKTERHGGNAVSSSKNKVERKKETDEERGNVVRGTKGKILMDEKEKMKGILRDPGIDDDDDDDEEEEEEEEEKQRNKGVKVSKRGGEIKFGSKDKKEIERNEEESQDEEYWFKEPTSDTKSGGIKLGNEKKEVVRNYQSDDEEEGRCNVVKSGKRSEEAQEGKKKDFDSSETSDEEEGRRYKVEKIDKRYREIDLGKKKKVESSEEETEEEEDERREPSSTRKNDADKWGKKKRRLERDDQIVDDDEGRKSMVKGSQRRGHIELRTKMKNDLRAVTDEGEEDDVKYSKEKNEDSMVKMLKSKDLRTKKVKVGTKFMQNEEENSDNGGLKDVMKDGKDIDGKKKFQLRGNTKEVGKVKAEVDKVDSDDSDGAKDKYHLQGKNTKVGKGKGKVAGHRNAGDSVDGSEDIDDTSLIKFVKKDFKPETSSKRGGKKLLKKKVGLHNMFKGGKGERSSEKDNVDNENADSAFRARNKAKKTFKADSQTEERRKGLKMDNREEVEEEEEDEDRTESDDGAYLFRGRNSHTKKNSHKPKVDLRRKHFSTDDPEDDCQMCHQCMVSNKRVVRCSKERNLNGYNRRYCESCIKRW